MDNRHVANSMICHSEVQLNFFFYFAVMQLSIQMDQQASQPVEGEIAHSSYI